jgi:hypothetical protein
LVVTSLQLPYRLGSGEGREPCALRQAKLHCFLTQCPLNPEASCTNVSEETPYTCRPRQRACARPTIGVARARWDKESRPAKPCPNPDDAGPIVFRLMGLPVTACCDTAWDRTRVCSDVSCTAMQCLRPLQHSWEATANGFEQTIGPTRNAALH